MARPGGANPVRESLGTEPGPSVAWPVALVVRARLGGCRVGLLLLRLSHRLKTVPQCAALFTGTSLLRSKRNLACSQRADARVDARGPGHSSPSPSVLPRGTRQRRCDRAFTM